MYENIEKFFTTENGGLYESIVSGRLSHFSRSIQYVKDAIYFLENYNYIPDSNGLNHSIRVSALRYWRACVSILALMDDTVSLEPNTIIQAGWGWLYDFMNWVTRYLLGISDHWALQMSPPTNVARQNFVLCDPDEPSRVLFSNPSEMIRAFARIDTNDLSSVRRFFWIHKVLRGCLLLISSDIYWEQFQPWDSSTSDVTSSQRLDDENGFLTLLEPPVNYENEVESSSGENIVSMYTGHSDLNDDDDDYQDEESYSYASDDDDESDEDSDEGPTLLSLRMKKRKAVEPNVPVNTHVKSYYGHCNVESIKNVNFYGQNDEYVMSGSDDGRFFIWDKLNASILAIIHGDSEAVNVIEGHPRCPTLAVSGIDSTVKIFNTENTPPSGCSRNHTSNSYKIIATNEMNRQQGSRDSYITRFVEYF